MKIMAKDPSQEENSADVAVETLTEENAAAAANGVLDGSDEMDDELARTVVDLGLQNVYLKARIGDLREEHGRSSNGSGGDGEEVKELREKMGGLSREIEVHVKTQKAAEDALEHLRVSYSEADGKAQELEVKLSEAQQKMEQEIKKRDDKNAELETKLGRVHKRAKQRIQEIQKEKDDIEAQLTDINTKVEQATNQQAATQKELERTRQQANEALRAMDAERQQLRTANNKLRDTVDELHRSVEAKANALEQLQQSYFEKEQLLEETRGLLNSGEEKRQASISELSAKHQKQMENMEAQLADALSERSKSASTISSLQTLLGQKDSKIAELEAASTGEVVRLGAALEEARGELIQLRDKHEQEKENWEAACQALRTKLEASEGACLKSEIEAAKMRSQLELELSTQKQLLSTRETELLTLKNEIKDLKSEFLAYKDRAHVLLQKKDAELAAAKDSELFKAQEEALNEVEKELAAALAERDKANQDLHDALTTHDKEISAREAALSDSKEQIRNLTMKLSSANARYLSEKETWKKNLEATEENWKLKYGSLEAQNSRDVKNDLQKNLDELKLQYKKLKEEHTSFRDIADRTIEDKEKEIAKLLEDNKNLKRSLELRPSVNHYDNQNSASLKQDTQSLDIAAAEQQILILARQQAQREEELAQSQRHILALQDEIEELERENRLHNQQEAVLKDELRNMERSQKRQGVDMTYLKNVILKLLETGEVEALLPVVGTLLQFSPEEIRKCQVAYRSINASSPSASSTDGVSTPSSIFSKFSFS